jgi:antirestriction protein ArdC
MGKVNAYEKVTATILKMVEETGKLPWQKSWRTLSGANAPKSIRGHVYRGINAFILAWVAEEKGYTDNRWITFKQAKAMGANVRKGETGIPIVFYNVVEKDTGEKDENGNAVKSQSFFLRYYTVFNVHQLDNFDDLKSGGAEEVSEGSFSPVEAAEQVTGEYLSRESIEVRYGGNRACYSPIKDNISMPKHEDFISPAHFYATLLHECAHSTGHKSRLNRKDLNAMVPFGSESYAREELVAEMASAFLYSEVGLGEEDLSGLYKNTAAYIKGWSEKIKDDPRMFVNACQAASKAADYIMNRKGGER